LHRQHPDTFARVERVRGRKRLYFAKDEQTLANSGVSVNPQRIPGTDYWVATNNDTDKKKEILAQVLRTLNYADHEVRAVAGLLV
jgi:negative modulator of initiation of replication